MMTDGSSYEPSGRLVEVDAQKAIPILNRRAALACTGPALLGEFLAANLATEFGSFDELIERGSDRIASLFNEYVERERGGDAVSTLFIVGWHEGADRPAAYGMDMQTDGPKAARVRKHNQHIPEPELFKLSEHRIGAVPSPTMEVYRAAGYDLTSDLNTVDAATDLLHLLEIQRRMQFDGVHYVGGHAMLTTITKTDMTQQIVHRWNEDRVGDVIKPQAIDWQKVARSSPRWLRCDGAACASRWCGRDCGVARANYVVSVVVNLPNGC
jgi:hypothetical protein